VIAAVSATVLRPFRSNPTGHHGHQPAAALQVWATNVIAFGLIYWELDRGGPVARTQKPREELPLEDFRFTQDETQDTVIEVAAGSSKKADWIPTSWTTCTCPPPTPVRSAQPTPSR
jgi:hypothetical protein